MTFLTTAVLADDEEIARRGARRMLEQHASVRVIAECADGAAAVAAVRTHKPDLLVLDIAMPDCDGFEALRRLGEAAPPTIMLTAYPENAVDAFDAGVLGFVPKPIELDRLLRSVERARVAGASGVREKQKREMPFAIRTRAGILLVRPSEVELIEGADNYVELCVGARRHLLHATLNRLEASLPAGFVRLHRSRIVNFAQVRSVRRKLTGDYEVILNSGRTVAVGRSFRERLTASWQGAH